MARRKGISHGDNPTWPYSRQPIEGANYGSIRRRPRFPTRKTLCWRLVGDCVADEPRYPMANVGRSGRCFDRGVKTLGPERTALRVRLEIQHPAQRGCPMPGIRPCTVMTSCGACGSTTCFVSPVYDEGQCSTSRALSLEVEGTQTQ